MTKIELIANIATDTNQPKTVVASVLDSLAITAADRLGSADAEFAIPGIGKLTATTRAARQGRNPRTGETIDVAASVSVKFKAAKSLKDAVN